MFILTLTIPSVCLAQQGAAPLQIASPPNGIVVNPGQTLSVSVTSPANINFASVAVVGEGPIGLSNIATSLPAQFSFTIPADVACRVYRLVAGGVTASGQDIESAAILIDVERPDLPVSLSTLMQGIGFQAQGQESPIILLGTFSDGRVLDVTESSHVVYSSSNTSVATVDITGIVKAVAPGTASVTATYNQGSQTVQVVVPVSVLPPVLSPFPASLTFGGQDVGTSSSPQALTLTNLRHGPVKVLSLDTTRDFSQTNDCMSSSPLAAGATCAVNVTFAPSGAGTVKGSITITNSFSNVAMTISLIGTGICHYVSITPSPSTVARGRTITVSGQLRSCATTTQTVVIQFVLTGPLQPGACGTTSSVMHTTPPFTLQPNTQRTVSFPFRIPSNTCPGSYTITATTSVGGTAVDTSSATLTVTSQ